MLSRIFAYGKEKVTINMAKIQTPTVLPYNSKSPTSIYEYSKGLLGNTLRDFVWEGYEPKKGKGALGLMAENILTDVTA